MNNGLNRKLRFNKRWKAYALLGGLIVLIIVAFFESLTYFDIGAPKKKMDDAKRYMDSLTEKDIQTWIRRTQTILKEDAPGEITNRDAPPDLQQLGITGINEYTDEVEYVWFGGMDNTALDVVRLSNGDFRVIAIYTPYTNSVIWPKP